MLRDHSRPYWILDNLCFYVSLLTIVISNSPLPCMIHAHQTYLLQACSNSTRAKHDWWIIGVWLLYRFCGCFYTLDVNLGSKPVSNTFCWPTLLSGILGPEEENTTQMGHPNLDSIIRFSLLVKFLSISPNFFF